MTWAERIYRLFLRAYPAWYRDEFAEPMARCFRDQLRAATSPGARFHLYLRTMADLLLSVPARHLERGQPVPDLALAIDSRRAFFFARHEASSFGRREITPDHMLLALLRTDSGLRVRIGPTAVSEIVQAIEMGEPRPRSTPPAEDLPLSLESRIATRRASEIARSARNAAVEPRHLLAAIVEQKQTRAARLLRERGIR